MGLISFVILLEISLAAFATVIIAAANVMRQPTWEPSRGTYGNQIKKHERNEPWLVESCEVVAVVN
jgi:hypothetical protein